MKKILHKKHAEESNRAEKKIPQENLSAETLTDTKKGKNSEIENCHSKV